MSLGSDREYSPSDFSPTIEEQAEYYENLSNSEQHFKHQKQNTMETGTFKSTVIEVESIKPWGEGQKKTFYHNLVMENGDKINIGKKTELTEGVELSYEIVEVGAQEYCKAKTYNPDFNQNGNSAPRPSTQQSNNRQSNASPNASFCLAYAKDVYVAHGGESPSNEIKDVSGYITGLADEFLTWLNENSK